MRYTTISSLLLLVAACSGGGGNSTTAPTQPAGSVQVVVDTATGTDALVQFQVVAATLENDGGIQTGNLLAAPKMLTLSDPMAQTDGVVLRDVPTGNYRRLRIGLAPGSGSALYPDGTSVGVSIAFELVVPFDESLTHDDRGLSWIVIGHYGDVPQSGASAPYSWSPMMRGRSSESTVGLAGLEVAWVGGMGLTAIDPRLDDAAVHVEFEHDCRFFDDDGNEYASRGEFLAAVRPGDDLFVDGRLHHHGRCEAEHVRRGRGNRRPRLIGRITEILPNSTTFVMDVLAEARRGAHSMLPVPERAVVESDQAQIERSGTHQYLPFGALAVGNLVKVEWISRLQLPNGSDEIVAHEIEVSPAGGVGLQPEWQGRVDAIDLQQRTITVVPRNNDPIVINGQAQNPVTVEVGPNVPIERRGNGGSGRTIIDLSEVVPGQDRIWWRGTVTGPAEVDATWVSVRDQN